MRKFFKTFTKKDGKCLELSVDQKELAIVFIPVKQNFKVNSCAVLLSQPDCSNYLKTQIEFHEQLVDFLGKDLGLFSYRLIGDDKVFSDYHHALAQFGLNQGKSVPIKEKSLFQFLPEEGRLRIETKRKIRVLVVDDSETIRKLLSRVLSEDSELECVGTVELPSLVPEAIERLKPDVITLDIHMPEMDGVELLKKLLPKYKIPMVMISSLSREDGTYVLDALESGAVDYIQKPSMSELPVLAPMIREKIKNARFAKIQTQSANQVQHKKVSLGTIDKSYLIAIGSSTGGTEALKHVLTMMPDQIPPIVIVQHIPAVFSKAFADRMNTLCNFTVKEAEDGDLVVNNHVYIAPGGKQMKLSDKGGVIRVIIDDAAPVNRHKPSVDYLFDSIAEFSRKKLVAGILTGMGADGAKGLLKLKQKGARTFAQDESSSVVYGMPKEAYKIGAVDKVVHIDLVAETILKACS